MTGSELKTWREDRGMLQDALAEKLGVHVMTVSKWEREAQAIPPFLELALSTIEREQTVSAAKKKLKKRTAAAMKTPGGRRRNPKRKTATK